MRFPALLVAASVLAACFVVAQAARADAYRQVRAGQTCGGDLLGDAASFNLFVHGDYGASSTSVEGRVAAGGSVSVNSYSVGTGLAANSGRVDLIAGGNLTAGGGGSSAANGSVTYAGTLQGTISTPNGTLKQAAAPFDFANDFASLQSTSTAIGQLAANGSAAGPSYAYDLIGTSTTTNVFSIPATDLQTAQVIRIKVPVGSSTVVNVTGDTYSSARYPTAAIQFWDGSTYVQPGRQTSAAVATLRSNLLWNFPTATSVQIGPSLGWQGSILAPRAAVTFPGSTDLFGTLIAASLANGNGSAWIIQYTGCVTPPATAPVAVDDAYQTDENETLEVDAPGVLDNDTYHAGATVATAVVANPQHGTVTLVDDGSFVYKPNRNFSGSDTFTYKLTADGQTSNVATVTISINPKTPVATKLVTFVARSCPTYADVTANLARNNIQESLEDLGADTLYTSGQPIDPDLEARGQPNCTPLSDWRFTLGTGYETRAVSGRWGSLSIVTNPFSTSIVTKDETPLLNDQGQNTGKEIEGAVTIELSKKQADLAAQSDSLWVQGGTPDDPVLDKIFPDKYGFAALRCAIDNLNGDNVEWVGYPSGASHVFCYAYYVTPPVPSGTIVVRKEVSKPDGATQAFPFHGNISFEHDQSFSLNVANGSPASTSFYRSAFQPGGKPWSFAEDVPDGWKLQSIKCTSADGGSKVTTDLAAASTAVELGPGDTVTCTYTDAEKPPPPGTLQITKTSLGGVGTFGYTVTPVGGGKERTATATTATPGVEVVATPNTIPLPAGTYVVAETLPTTDAGTWTLTGVTCNGKTKEPGPVTVTVSSGAGVSCGFENTFVPAGSITIRKVAFGGTGTAGFNVYPVVNPDGIVYSKTAKVDTPGVSVLAQGEKTDALPLGAYRIQEFAPPGTDPAGWALTSVVCNGELLGSSQGAVQISLTAAKPAIDCTFTNTFTPEPTPPPEPPPTPDPDPVPEANVKITKTADKPLVDVGQIVTYAITVTNTGDAAAKGVTISEQAPIENGTIVSITPDQGSCSFVNYPASCDIGTVAPGQTVKIVAKVRATHAGPLPNHAAVNSDTVIVHPPKAEGGSGAENPPAPKPKPKPTPPTSPTHPTKPGTPPPLTG